MLRVRNRSSPSASLLLLLHLQLETRGEPLGELHAASRISPGLRLTRDLASDPEVGHGRLNQLEAGLSEGAPQLGPPVLKPDLRERKRKINATVLFYMFIFRASHIDYLF